MIHKKNMYSYLYAQLFSFAYDRIHKIGLFAAHKSLKKHFVSIICENYADSMETTVSILRVYMENDNFYGDFKVKLVWRFLWGFHGETW